VNLFVAPTGITMLSVQIIAPSVGTTKVSPSVPDEARSPDHTIAAHVFFDAKFFR
jgi:hypothetical protein